MVLYIKFSVGHIVEKIENKDFSSQMHMGFYFIMYVNKKSLIEQYSSCQGEMLVLEIKWFELFKSII